MEIEIIVKEARDLGTWRKEKLSLEGLKRMFAERLIGDYAEKMEMLREIDNNIYNWLSDLTWIVKEIKQAVKANRLLDLARLLQLLNDRFSSVVSEGEKIKNVSDLALQEFDKQASLLSDWKRKWVYEKLLSQRNKERKEKLDGLVKFTESLLGKVNVLLKHMGVARAHGEIGKYIDLLHTVGQYQKQYQDKYIPIYDTYLKPLVDDMEKKKEIQEQEKVQQPKAEETLETFPEVPEIQAPELLVNKAPSSMVEQEIPTVPAPTKPVTRKKKEAPPQIPITKTRIEAPKNLGQRIAPIEPEEPEVGSEKETLPTEEQAALEKALNEAETSQPKVAAQKLQLQNQHKQFVSDLIRIASLDMKEAASFMLHYSQKIENKDTEASLKLLAIAEGLLGN